jgi:membrane fusion protein, multidrug efflux system
MNVHDKNIEPTAEANTTGEECGRADASETGETMVKPVKITPAPTPSIREEGEHEQRPPDRQRATGLVAIALRTGPKVLLPIVVIAAGYATYSGLLATRPDAPVRPKQERTFTVEAVTARSGSHQPTVKLFGSTVAGRQVDIRTLVSGQIIETGKGLREGGQIEAGALLVKIDPFDYRNALSELNAQLAEAKAKIAEFESSLAAGKESLAYARDQLRLAQIDLKRAEPLSRQGVVSQRTVDDRRQILLQREQAADELENNLKVWEARIAQQKAVADRLETAIERATRRLTETELRAPFPAYVTDVAAQVGRMMSSNDKVATLIDQGWIEVRFNLTDDQFGRIVAKEGRLTGRQVLVRWVLGKNTFTYPATIERIGAEISSATGGVEVFARIKSPAEPVPLRPGAFVEVLVPDTTYENVFRLPSTALYGGDTVYAIKDGRLEARKVKVVGGIDEDLLIEGPLEDGDRIMTTRISTPGDGVKVADAGSQ